MGYMDAVSMFQTQVSKVSFQVEKASFETQVQGGWGGQEKQTNCEEEKLLLQEKQLFQEGAETLISGCQNKCLCVEKDCFQAEKTHVHRKGCGRLSFRLEKQRFPNLRDIECDKWMI